MDPGWGVYGASGHCKVIIDIFNHNKTTIDYVLDDNSKLKTILDKTVTFSKYYQMKTDDEVLLTIGNNEVRKKLAAKFKVNYITAVHPNAILSNYSTIDVGTVVMAGAVINPDSKIGKHCIINTGAIIEHDCTIHDFVHISPSASLAGGVEVGEGTQIGINATVIQGIKIGKWCIIGAGAVLVKDIPDFSVVVGNPGRIIKTHTINE